MKPIRTHNQLHARLLLLAARQLLMDTEGYAEFRREQARLAAVNQWTSLNDYWLTPDTAYMEACKYAKVKSDLALQQQLLNEWVEQWNDNQQETVFCYLLLTAEELRTRDH